MTSNNFYKAGSGRRKTLKKTIRPTYKNKKDFTEPRQVGSSASSASQEVQQINELIQQATNRLKQIEEEEAQRAKLRYEAASEDEPEEYDGMSDEQEQLKLLSEEIDNLRREHKKLHQELTDLKQEFVDGKKVLEKKVSQVKSEVVTETKVEKSKPTFSFSDELDKALKAIETMGTDLSNLDESFVQIDQPPPEPTTNLTETETKAAVPLATLAKTEDVKTDKPTQAEEVQPTKVEDPKKGKEKKLLMAAVTLFFILVAGGGVSYKLTSSPAVDPKLVDEYLSQVPEGQVMGMINTAKTSPSGIEGNKDAEVSYDQLEWDKYSNLSLGIEVSYPANAIERLQGSNSVTFLRKDSYIFKVQIIDSSLDLEDFWTTRQDPSVKTDTIAETFKDKPALHVIPLTPTEYPGERYLIKQANSIVEVWFALEGGGFTSDEAKMAQTMLESLVLTKNEVDT